MWDDIPTLFVTATFASFYCGICYIWKVSVPNIWYGIFGGKNLESKTTNEKEDVKSEQSSCKIEIEKLKKDVLSSETLDSDKKVDLENIEKDLPKYSELFVTA